MIEIQPGRTDCGGPAVPAGDRQRIEPVPIVYLD